MHYMFDNCDTVALAKEYGTPLYVMSETHIMERCAEIRRDFLEKYENTRALFASKAFQTLEMCRIITREGLGMDVVSGGEIYTAIKAGAKAENLMFHGNNKTQDEIDLALTEGVGTFVSDSLSELELLNERAGSMGKKASVLLRVTPGVDSHTHQYISTGHLDSKFGFSPNKIIEPGFLTGIVEGFPNIDLKGFHFHVGSQLTDNKSHLLATEILLNIILKVNKEFGFVTRELNLGGGYGIQYAGEPERKPVSHFIDPMMEKIESFCAENGIERPFIIIEPGRWICGEAGITIYEIGSIKEAATGRVYAAVNGGFGDNPRPALYQAKYDVVYIENPEEPAAGPVTIAGKCCESGDILVWDAEMPQLKRGDLIAVTCTGAYNYSMASTYNRNPRPALVMTKDGESRLSVKRETYEDLLKLEI